MPEEKKPINPLKVVWNIISTISGAVGLVSFADSWHQWNDVFEQMIAVYRGIVYWPFDWIPFYIDDFSKDYLFLGLLLSTSITKVIGFPFARKESKRMRIYSNIAQNIFVIFAWPWILLAFFLAFTEPKEDKNITQRHVIYWWAAIVISFLVFLLISVIMNR